MLRDGRGRAAGWVRGRAALEAVTARGHVGFGRERRERREGGALVFGHGGSAAVPLRPPPNGVLVAVGPRGERHAGPLVEALLEDGPRDLRPPWLGHRRQRQLRHHDRGGLLKLLFLLGDVPAQTFLGLGIVL